MPPLRTFSATKPMKTERTHEENQERAYIAASRRSDRSLEARVESARRASEIHKRRTGRSLRVTEQDVINEEMYEEEDDDMPLGYRRLTAHLQTGSADFDRRLSAYLANHVAMRSALDQAIHPYGFQNTAQMTPSLPQLFPSPLNTQGLAFSPQQTTPTSPRAPHPYRQTPYPMPGASGYRAPSQGLHSRSASISLPHGLPMSTEAFPSSPVEQSQATTSRRMSMPTSAARNEASLALSPQRARPTLSRISSSSHQSLRSPIMDKGEAKSSAMAPPSQSYFDTNQQLGISPLTMSLPQDSRRLLGSALDPNDPFTSMLMSGDSTGMYNAGPYESIGKPAPTSSDFAGMDSTLAPSALSMSPGGGGETAAADFNASLPSNFSDLKGFDFPGSQNSSNGEGSTTGLDRAWNAFIDDNSWTENAA